MKRGRRLDCIAFYDYETFETGIFRFYWTFRQVTDTFAFLFLHCVLPD